MQDRNDLIDEVLSYFKDLPPIEEDMDLDLFAEDINKLINKIKKLKYGENKGEYKVPTERA